MIRRVIGEDIELEFIPAPRPGLISADRGQLEQVLMNLCLNARDTMPRGGRITLKTEPVLLDGASSKTNPGVIATGRFVLLSIRDMGCGMDADTHPHGG